MTPNTEIAYFPLRTGSNIKDANSPAGEAWARIIEQVLAQPGAERGYFGMEVENPSMLRVFVDWESLEDHKKFLASDAFKAVSVGLESIQDGEGAIYNAPLLPHPPSAALSDANAPVTEIITLYFPPLYSAEDQTSFEKNIKQLIACIEENAQGYKGSAGAWIVEEVGLPKTPSEKAKAYTVVIGWESVEAHMVFLDTQVYKDHSHLIRDAKDFKDSSVVHVKLVEVQKGGRGIGVEDEGEGVSGGSGAVNARGEVLNA